MCCQDKIIQMEPKGDRERGESLVCRDHLAHIFISNALAVRVLCTVIPCITVSLA